MRHLLKTGLFRLGSLRRDLAPDLLDRRRVRKLTPLGQPLPIGSASLTGLLGLPVRCR
jgi:hypothetical protein